MNWLRKLLGLTPWPTCAVCDVVIYTPSPIAFYDYTLCQKHNDMARGAFEWTLYKIEHDISDEEKQNLANTVISVLRESQ